MRVFQRGTKGYNESFLGVQLRVLGYMRVFEEYE